MNIKVCPGCETGNPEDHVHQYINVFGNTITVYSIDGKVFKTSDAAVTYLESEVGWDRHQALGFLSSLKRKYN